jgi:cobalt-zinc-cadmium efflux system protein
MGHDHDHGKSGAHATGHDDMANSKGGDHGSGGGGSHNHSHAPASFGRAFLIGITLNLGFVVIEAIYGLLAHSLSLVADAGHNLSDVLGLALAWGASILVRRLPTQRRTYGLRRTSILVSLFNALVLLVSVGVIAWEAVVRLWHPEPVASGIVMAVAAIGIGVNGITAWLFMAGQKHDVNIRGAFMHMASDAVISLGVVLAALAMRYTGWLWLDPVVSLIIVVVIAISTWSLLSESLDLVLDAVPARIDPEEVEAWLAGLPNVVAVHDLHIWGMSTTEAALTVHLVKPDASIDDALLARINRELHAKFGIDHVTVQFELGDVAHPCGQAPMSAV